MKTLRTQIGLIIFITIGLTSISYGKDFQGSLRNLQSEIEDVLQIVGVISLLIAGGIFYVSRQKGFEHLTSAIIGTVIFGSASTIFSILMRVFA